MTTLNRTIERLRNQVRQLEAKLPHYHDEIPALNVAETELSD